MLAVIKYITIRTTLKKNIFTLPQRIPIKQQTAGTMKSNTKLMRDSQLLVE